MRIIAFITETAPVEQILTHIGEPPRPPPISPARGPPAWDEAPEPMPDWDLLQQPEPDLPRRHRHRYHGVLAPNAPLRAVAIAFGREVAEATDSPSAASPPPPTPASNARSPARYLWVMRCSSRSPEPVPTAAQTCA
jgi:hypothetical protein